MPAVSKAQQHMFGMVHALKKGTLKLAKLPASLRKKIQKAAAHVSAKVAKKFAKTKTKNLPKHVKEGTEKNSLVLPDMTFKEYLIFEHVLLQEMTEEEALVVEKLLKE